MEIKGVNEIPQIDQKVYNDFAEEIDHFIEVLQDTKNKAENFEPYEYQELLKEQAINYRRRIGNIHLKELPYNNKVGQEDQNTLTKKE